jgi:hypothetical protein
MRSHANETIWIAGIVVAVLIFVVRLPFTPAAAAVQGAGIAQPRVEITDVPPAGEGPTRRMRIAGTVSGVDLEACGDCRIVLYAETDVYYVQPFANAPFTTIRANGTWETRTHLGYYYVALLVRASYRPPSKTDTLPEIGGAVLALTRVPARRSTPPDQR